MLSLIAGKRCRGDRQTGRSQWGAALTLTSSTGIVYRVERFVLMIGGSSRPIRGIQSAAVAIVVIIVMVLVTQGCGDSSSGATHSIAEI